MVALDLPASLGLGAEEIALIEGAQLLGPGIRVLVIVLEDDVWEAEQPRVLNLL